MIECIITMAVSAGTLGWGGLAVILFLTSFGTTGGLWLMVYLLSFIAGAVVMLFYNGMLKSDSWLRQQASSKMPPASVGIPTIIEILKRGQPKPKFDKRMTGSNIIDEVLQEVLEYTYRDYIHSWYRKISDDQGFQNDMRLTLQRVIIAFSERAKEVDLVPYLTTRLVDDFASHIRLYRRASTKLKEHKKDDTKPAPELLSTFFDMETEMENNICRDMICMNEDSERQYLQDLSEVLLFLLLPPEDFHNKPFRYIVREVLVNGVILPTINLISDPDYINQTISWLCKEHTFNNDSFLTILKTSDSPDELTAIRDKVDLEITRQRSKDTGGDDDTEIKQKLNSLVYVKNLCESRILRLQKGEDDPDGGLDINKLLVPGQRLYSLPFDVVINNNVALSYFIDFMTTIGAQGYLFFYLTVEGYRVSSEQQISAALLIKNGEDKPDLESLRDAAFSIYNQYLSEKSSPRLEIEENIIQKLLDKIQNKPPDDTVFDDIQMRVCELLQEDPQFFPAFRKSPLYVKLLAELDLLKDKSDDGLSNDEDFTPDSSKCNSLRESREDLVASCDSLSSTDTAPYQPQLKPFTLMANITNTGICREHGKAYAIYMITVTKTRPDNTQDVWDVYRRYSDFHDLHMTIQDRFFDTLGNLAFPSKKTFNNMSKEFLEKRKIGLNTYLENLLSDGILRNNRGLNELVYQFLEHIVWEKEPSQIVRKVNTVVNPLKNSVRNVGNFVKSMPDNFVDGVARMSGGIKSIPNNMLDGMGKILNVKGPQLPADVKGSVLDSCKVGASLNTEHDEDNIPLRIMLLMMDEVFDLKSRNQWLRRRLTAILRQIVKTMFGDSINRKIVEQVEWMTSSEQIAENIKSFRDSFWPGGTLAEPRAPRDHRTKMNARVVCRAKMFATMSEELRHPLGSETTREGVVRVFNMFQHTELNKRLVYVILEGMLQTLFPDNKFTEVFHKMHSRSPRVKKEGAASGSS